MSKLPPISVSKFLDDVSTQILLLTSLSLRQSLVQPSWGCQLFWPHASRAFFRFALFRVFCLLFLDFLFIAEKECLNAAFQVFWSWLRLKSVIHSYRPAIRDSFCFCAVLCPVKTLPDEGIVFFKSISLVCFLKFQLMFRPSLCLKCFALSLWNRVA